MGQGMLSRKVEHTETRFSMVNSLTGSLGPNEKSQEDFVDQESGLSWSRR